MAPSVHHPAPAGLTSAQREAVTAPDPVLCVMAGAGTGKTRVLTLRVARRLHDGSAGSGRVLVCTFSRKAADELRHRLWAMGAGTAVEAGTFHRTAWRLVRQHESDRGSATPALVVDRKAMLATVLDGDSAGGGTGNGRRSMAPKDSGGAARRRRGPSPAQLESEISWAKARQVGPEAYEEAARRAGRRPPMGAARIADLYARYEAAKQRKGALDLDDLLWVAADVLEDDPTFAAVVRWRYRHLFVDEMQDANPAQFRLLQALMGEQPDLCVVGDPHQSVYGWNGADPTLLQRLPEILPGARVIHLHENHRCSPQVVAVAVAALGLDGERAPTSVRPDGPVPRIVAHPTDGDEAAWVAREAWRAHRPGRRWDQIAVLARTNAQLSAVAHALEVERIPYRVAGGDLAPASDLLPDERRGTEGGTGTARVATTEDDAGTEESTGPGGSADTDAGAVVLSTFHRAKGLQWPTVFVIGLSAGLVPIASARSRAALEEERRLLYVALTRAEDELTCTWSTLGDDRELRQGAPPREPSPWIEQMVRVRDDLVARDASPDPASVRTHVASLRARIGEDPPAGGPPASRPRKREPARDAGQHG
jgi:DNA helicase-2/ATP-dependent DNA helicase PcrA